jgi:hypothetical protein
MFEKSTVIQCYVTPEADDEDKKIYVAEKEL